MVRKLKLLQARGYLCSIYNVMEQRCACVVKSIFSQTHIIAHLILCILGFPVCRSRESRRKFKSFGVVVGRRHHVLGE